MQVIILVASWAGLCFKFRLSANGRAARSAWPVVLGPGVQSLGWDYDIRRKANTKHG